MESDLQRKAQLSDPQGRISCSALLVSKNESVESARAIAALVSSLVVLTGALLEKIDSLQKLISQDQEDGDEWKKKDV